MQFQNNSVPSQITNNISKIDQLLRMYQMCKKSDISLKNNVNKKITDLLKQISLFDERLYKKIQEFVNKSISIRLEDPKIKIQKTNNNLGIISKKSNQFIGENSSMEKFMSQNKNISGDKDSSSRSKQIFQKNNNYSNVLNNLSNTNVIKQPSNNLASNSASNSTNSFNSLNSQTSLSNFLKLNQKQQKHLMNRPFNSDSNSNSIDKPSSQSNSISKLIPINHPNEILKNNINNLQKILSINQDIFGMLKQLQENNKFLFVCGVNIPEKRNDQNLHVSTLMKFSKDEVQNYNYNPEGVFEKQYKAFQNNLRHPIGIILLSKSMQQIKIQHIKFLIQLKCISPLIIFIQSISQKKGFILPFSYQSTKSISQLNKIQHSEYLQQLNKSFPKLKIDLSRFQISVQRLIITKQLPRNIPIMIQSAKNAIQIQSNNQMIKQQTNFPYKLHTKFYVSSKSQFQVYFLQNQILAIKISYKQKQFDNFKKFVMQQAPTKGTFILSASVMKQTSQIKKDFFKLLYQSKNRDPYFIVNFTGINNKKSLILTMKQNISEDYINSFDTIQFKDLEKDHQLTNLVVLVNKQNYKNYQTDSKVEVVDLTVKKK